MYINARGSILLMLLKDKKDLIGAEIGVFEGELSGRMLYELAFKKYYLIDPWERYPEYEYETQIFNRLSGAKTLVYQLKNEYPDKIEIIEKYSIDAAQAFDNSSLDFVYIDANHKYEYVLQDIGSWHPKVIKGGIIAGHDYRHKPVANAVRDYCVPRGITYHNYPNTYPEDWWFINE